MERRVVVAITVLLLFGVIGLTQDRPAIDITINFGAYFFAGPDGRSGSTAIPPVNVVTLRNGQTVRLIFPNTDSTSHKIGSSLFAAVDDSSIEILDASDLLVATISGRDMGVIELQPGWKARVTLTPRFRSVEDGGALAFELNCHRDHGTAACHFLRGMKALITVVRSQEDTIAPPPPPPDYSY